MPVDERSGFVTAAREVVEKSGFDPSYYFFEDTAGNEPYFFYAGGQSDPKDRIYVETGFSRPEIQEISEISPAVRGLQRVFHSPHLLSGRCARRDLRVISQIGLLDAFSSLFAYLAS